MKHSLKPFRLLVTAAALGLSVALSAPALAQGSQPIEPIDLPPSVEQGVDMIYIDPEIAPRLDDANVAMHQISFEEWAGAPLDLFLPVNPIYTDLRRGLVRYRQKWGDLPQFQIPAGPAMKLGSQGMNVAMLRQRFGLAPGANLPEAPSDEEVERAARALGAPIPAKSDEMREAEVE